MAINYRQSLLIVIICSLLSVCLALTIPLPQENFSWQRSLSSNTPVCVDIPVNLTLCHGIGYTKMRLPNLLHHDSLYEAFVQMKNGDCLDDCKVSQQAVSWIPLSQLGCHPDTQLFLCSLFTPVCLDHPIPPCRSLCLSVQSSCESTMIKYGYPWPNIVRCDQFPVDNDMCIQAQHKNTKIDLNLANKAITSPGDLEPQKHHFNPQTQKPEKRRNKHKRKHKHDNHRGVNENESGKPGAPWNWNPPHEETKSTKSEFLVENPVEKRNTNENDVDGKKIFMDIISKYCLSEWSIKARGAIQRANNSVALKVRNYRVLHGNFPSESKTVQIHVPLNISEELSKSELTKGARRRFYIMGRAREAVFVMHWPHKLGQFRKALKTIKSGEIKCEVGDSLKSTQPSKVENDSERNERRKEKQRLREERKEERRRQRRLKKDQNNQKSSNDLKSLASGKYQISVTSDDEKAAKIDGNNTVEMDESEVFVKNFAFTVKGVILGKANNLIRLKRQKDSEWIQVLEKTLKMAVLRVKNPLHQYFTIFIAILVCINNTNIGCILDLKVIRDVLRRPIAPIIGFLCQFLFVPLASFGFGKVYFVHNNAWKLGLIGLLTLRHQKQFLGAFTGW
ncbi:Secreted frizzled-related protein 5-like protein [Dinothrombium tinctorium]|uniref:Secreted frizzled-related protein 5-like protein n=1 Tax=Dinothrombium tinctorium TaxID=1965070 RepID=A0A3S3PSE2_9ACAR|nr:Secreted frizzled-related protein 5-like protein [Dinothrombium tinctorium]